MTFDHTDQEAADRRAAKLFRIMETSELDTSLQVNGAALVAAGAKLYLLTSFADHYLASALREHAVDCVEKTLRDLLAKLATYRHNVALDDATAAKLQRDAEAKRAADTRAALEAAERLAEAVTVEAASPPPMTDYTGTGDTYPDSDKAKSPPPLPEGFHEKSALHVVGEPGDAVLDRELQRMAALS